MRMKVFALRMGNDYLDDAVLYLNLRDARQAFKQTATELARYGQAIEATIHMADTPDHIVEYPDYTLKLNGQGRVIMDRVY